MSGDQAALGARELMCAKWASDPLFLEQRFPLIQDRVDHRCIETLCLKNRRKRDACPRGTVPAPPRGCRGGGRGAAEMLQAAQCFEYQARETGGAGGNRLHPLSGSTRRPMR